MTKMIRQDNGHAERVAYLAPLWTFLFGPFYFAYKGVWRHAVLGFCLGFVTLGVSWLVYPFFARGIIKRQYGRDGFMTKGAARKAAKAEEEREEARLQALREGAADARTSP